MARSKLKNIFSNTLLVLISTILSISILEFSVRKIFPIYDPCGILKYKYYPQDNVVLSIKNFSGRQWISSGDYNVSVSINKYGFRDKHDLITSERKDYFVVGDSFSFGHGVEERARFSNLIEKDLGVSVYNISSPGNLIHYKNLIDYSRKKGAKVKNIIVGVCMENDLEDYRNTNYEEYRSNTSKSPFSNFKEWLKLNSAVYNAFATTIQRNEFLRNTAIKLGIAVHTYGIINAAYSDEALSSSVEKLNEICLPYNAAIIIIPSRALWVGNHKDQESLIHKKFVTMLKKKGLKVIDLRAYFEKNGYPMCYYFKNDAHWNTQGHKLAARAIVDYISNSALGGRK